MVQRGRPTSAASMVKRWRASAMAKERVHVILENLGGSLPVAVACRRLAVSPALFYRFRIAALGAMIGALEPRPRGRPPREVPMEGRRLRELQETIERLEEDLAYSRVREELALLAPRRCRREKK